MEQIYDPGLQQERTVLAWDRTGLALMVAAGLFVRANGAPALRLANLIPAFVFLAGVVVLLLDRPRYLARWRRLEEGNGMLEAGPVLGVAAATAVLGVAALVTLAL